MSRFETFWVVLCIAPMAIAQENRTVDGSGNNLDHMNWGQAGTNLLRGPSGSHYADGIGLMLDHGVSPRAVSNAVSAQMAPANINSRSLSSMFWQWGQFIDHDLDLTPDNSGEYAPVPVPLGDPYFDPMGTGTAEIPFFRSGYTGGIDTQREHQNVITHWIDASNVYGSDQIRADWLREGSGGRLKMSDDGYMPYNTDGLPNAMGTDPTHFVGGDIRANEQVGLTSMHTVFVREHNRWADFVATKHPFWSDEQVYQYTRKIVGAEMQSITYNEWLPSLLGPNGLSDYAGYDSSVEPSTRTEFSTAAFRFGHTMLNDLLLRLNEDGSDFDGGHLNLFESFFNPGLIVEPGSMDAILRGLAGQQANEIDTQAVESVRNLLFGPPGAGGLDLISLNLQRGRDHGLPDYNALRVDYGLSAVEEFDDITSDAALAAALEAVYVDVDNIDPWIGLFAEDHLAGGSLGETATAILVDQFERVRDGDRFFYLNDPMLDDLIVQRIENLTLSDIIVLNTDVEDLQDNVFVVPAPASGLVLAGSLLAFARRRRA